MKNRDIKAITSEEFTGIKLTKPSSYAAGAKGVQVALDHAISEMGVVRAFQTLAKLNQKDGFDCPGCAWPDPDDKRSLFAEYCENGAKAVAEEATLKRVGPDFFQSHSIQDLSNWSDFELGKSGRLTHPLILKEGSDYYERIEWDDAFALIAKQLQILDDPNEAVFYTSGRSSNEAAFLYGLFCRAYGTNNMPDCSNMCHESSGVGLSETVGIGKGSVILGDFPKAELVVVMGQNPGTNHPRMLTALQECKNNGGKVITINPLEEAGLKRFKNPQKPLNMLSRGTTITDIFLQVKINEDIALLKVIMKKLYEIEKIDGNVFDKEFINSKTANYNELIEDLDQYSINELVQQSGVDEKLIDKAVQLFAERQKIIICWAMGLTQHKNGVENIKECVNLLLLKGSIGKEGAGTCPVRGHSNVQGDRTVGIVHRSSPGLTKSLKKVFDIDAPQTPGHDVVHCIMAMYEKRAKIFVALGGNFVSAASDTNYTAKAIQNCDLTVSISTKLNRSHLIAGKQSLILPTLGRSETDLSKGKNRFVTVENSMGKVHKSEGHLDPASDQLMSEPEIIAKIAKYTLDDTSKVPWLEMAEDYDLIRDKISEVLDGFDSYNKKVKSGEGFYLPNNSRIADFSKLPDGKAQFSINKLSDHKLEEDDFILMSIRSHDQYNTTIYGLDDRYRGVYNERRVLFMNPLDMEKFGFSKLDIVDISSHYDGIKRLAPKFLIVPYAIPRQNLACYFPEANVLVPINHFATSSNTPISKSIKVKINA